MSFFIWRRGSENSDSMDRQRSPSRVISDPSKLSVISKGHQASPYGDLRRSQWKDDQDESQHVVCWDNDELIDEIDKTTEEKRRTMQNLNNSRWNEPDKILNNGNRKESGIHWLYSLSRRSNLLIFVSIKKNTLLFYDLYDERQDLCHRISVSKMAMDLFHCRYGFLPKAY